MDKPYDEGSKVLFYDEKQNINHGVTCEIVKSYVGYGERTYYDAYLNDDKRNTVQVSHDQLYDDNPKNRKSFSVPDKLEPLTPSTKKYVKPNDDLPPGMARCECCEIVKAREQFYANKKRFCSKSCSHSYSARHRQGYQRGRKPSESYANAHNAQRERKEQDRNMPLSSYIRKYKPGREEVLKIMTTDKDKEVIEKVASNWNWSIYLEEKRAIAAPVSYFKYAVLRDMLTNGSMVGAMVEVKNMDAPKQLEGFWIAQIIEEGGYRAKLRYLGTEHKSKMDFWVNLFVDGNVDCVGHSVNGGLPMLPPWCVGSSQIEDYSFLVDVVSKCRTLPIDWKDIVKEHLASPVKIGSRLEIMDPSCLYHCRIGIVREVIGGRIRVEYEDKKADEQNFWTHIKSEAVHPIGWSDKVGTKMQSKLKKNYTHVAGVENVPPELFATLPEWDKSKHGQFEVGMKLETVDPLKLSTIRVGTVMKVLKHGYFIVGIDGMDVLKDAESKCYIHHYTSTSVFPAGYSRQNNVRVQGPEQFHDNNGAGHFMWSKYLDSCDAIAAPSKLFQCERTTPTSNPCHQFKVGMKLEAVDLLNPHLICVATVVKCMAGSLLQIHFDGWVDDHDQWLDANCAHLFPVGWCELFGYELQIPDTSTDEEDKVEVEKEEEAGEQEQRKKRSKSKSPRKRGKRRNAGKNNSLDEDFMTEEYQDFIE